MAGQTIDEMLASDMAAFYDNPLGWVLYSYAWDTDPSLQICKLQSPWKEKYGVEYGPDAWACEFLDKVGEQVRERNFDGRNAVRPIRMATASGHGIGKSALTAWLVGWIMSTRPFARGVVTANTAPQLESKTWAEIGKWSSRSIVSHWFDVSLGKGSMKMTHKAHPSSWRCDAQTAREENSESFAGLHAASSTPFYVVDEASAIPDKIFEVVEGGLTDGEPMVFLFGNPTRNTGAFYDCFHKQRHRWITRQIDSRSVQITNKELIQGWVDDHGENSDFCKIRIRGIFPAMSAKQFISVADVDAAFGRYLRLEQYSWAPKILGVDPSWSGEDEFVIGLRQGLSFQVLRTIQKNDNDVEMANLIARLEDEHQADAVFVDAGYGTGIVSVGNSLGRNWILCWFGEKAHDPGYLNKRSEIWGAMRDWLKAGGSIPPDQVLYTDLISPETVPRPDGRIQLESKVDMKRRKVPSPNRADALALTFAYPVQAKSLRSAAAASQAARRSYDPYSKHAHDPYSRRSSRT